MLQNARFLYFLATILIIGVFAGVDSLMLGTRAQSEKRTTARRSGAASNDSGGIDSEDPAGTFVVTFVNGQTSCRRVSTDEEKTLLHGDRSLPLHAISPLLPAAQNKQTPQAQTGLKIILRATNQFENFNVKLPFLRAAAHWEQVIKTPITVIIDVDYGPTRFGTPFPQGVLGATSTQTVTNDGSYTDIRNGLISSATNQSESALYSALPNGTVPTDSGSTSSVSSTTANLRALGLLNPVADPNAETNLGAPPAIGFNSNFNYDFDPSNGIEIGRIDFDAVVTHEIGHLLGFISNVGLKELHPETSVSVTPWDLFRFRPGITTGDFSTSQRVLTSGGDQVFFNGSDQVPVSTGRPDGTGGDGRQPSHWKDDIFVGGHYIGIMDPSAPSSQRNLITNDDLKVLDLIGYQIDQSTPDNLNQELSADDGSAEVGSLSTSDIVVNRLTPSQYPSALRKIRMFFRQESGLSNPGGTKLRVLAYTASGANGITVFGLRPLVDQTIIIPTVAGSGQFVDLDLPLGPTISSGDWYIGYQLPNPNTSVTFVGDANGTLHSAGFISVGGGATFQPLTTFNTTTGTNTPANLMVRAVVTSSSCSVTVLSSQLNVDSAGGPQSVAIQTGPGCVWNLASDSTWISSDAIGSGSGSVPFNVQPNISPASRNGNLVIGDQFVRISQAALPLLFDHFTQVAVQPSGVPGQCSVWPSQVIIPSPANAGLINISLRGPGLTYYFRLNQPVSGSAPNLVSDSSFQADKDITLTAASTPSLQAGVYYVTATNCTSSLIVGSIAPVVYGPSCPYSLSTNAVNFPPEGGTGTLSVNTLPGCSWSIQSNAPENVTLAVDTTTRYGPGDIPYTVAPNVSIKRTTYVIFSGTMSAPGSREQQFLVNQPSLCLNTLTPSSVFVSAAGGQISTMVHVSMPTCLWNPQSEGNPQFVGIISVINGSGSGNGKIDFNVLPNNGSRRSQVYTIADQQFTVNQDPPCSYAIDQSNKSFSAGGGSGTINVTTGADCHWTATSNSGFVTVDSGGTKAGPTSVSYTVLPNPTGSARSGTITVAGKTFTVTQDGDCGFSIDANQQSFASTGGTGGVNVTSNGCHWTAVSNNPDFITITSGTAGDTTGPVGFTVAVNNGPARTGTMTIAGKTFLVNQAAPPCFTTVSKDSALVQSPGGSVSVQVNAPDGCNYSVISNAGYMTITSGSSSSGPATVTFDVAENTNLEPRAGTIIIAGLTVLVTQLGTNGIHYGDLNLDNKVNVNDLLLLANVLAGNTTISVPEAADVRLDHKVNVSDLLTLANGLAGNIRFLPSIPVLNVSSILPPSTPPDFSPVQNSVGEQVTNVFIDPEFSGYTPTTDRQQNYLLCIWPERIEQRRKSVTSPGNPSMHYHQ